MTTAGLAILVTLGGAVAYGFTSPLAKLAYLDGAEPVTLLAFRGIAGLLLLSLWSRAAGRAVLPPRRHAPAVILLGIAFGLIAGGYLGAVALIPVALAALLFFTYPVMVAFGAVVAGSTGGMARRLAACLLALTGLALALGIDAGGLDPRGIALALTAAIACAVMLTFTGRLVRALDPIQLQTGAQAVPALVFTTAVLATGGLQLPESWVGWTGLLGHSLLFVLGTLSMLYALGRLPAAQVALLGNLEPVVTIGLAVTLLGEPLSALQALGAALVLVALFLGTR